MNQHIKRRCCLLFMGIAAVFMSGCGSAFQTLNLKDTGLMPSARAGKALYRSDPGLPRSVVQTELAVDAGVFHLRGKDATGLFSQARIGDQTFPGSGTLDTRFNFTAVDISANWRHAFFNRRLGYDLSAGVGYATLNLRASSAGLEARDSAASMLLQLGAGAFWRVYRETSVEISGSVLEGSRELNNMHGHRFVVAQSLGGRATVYGGYAAWTTELSGGNRSRVQIDFSGPTAGARVRF
jgi:hypothetical protein